MEQQAVRFASRDDEIAPDENLQPMANIMGKDESEISQALNADAEEELQQLKTTLRNNIQSSRMQHHAFEPISLPGSQPASRVPSGTNTPSRRHIHAGSVDASPRPSPTASAIHSPPLTPAASQSRDGKPPPTSVPSVRQPHNIMTPQRSKTPPKDGKASNEGISSYPRQQPMFSIGPTGDSQPPSKEHSPARTPASTAPGTPRPYAPADVTSDPSHTGKRPKSEVDYSRYRFGDRDPAIGFANSGQANATLPVPTATVPRPSTSSSGMKTPDEKSEKRSSLFGSKFGRHDDDHASSNTEKSSHSSKSNLKRFFKFGEHKHHHKDKDKHGSISEPRDGTRTPPNGAQSTSVPFADDHGLASKYGKFGKMLGSGAGGSVRLMKRTGDGTVFAVKQFRDRHAYESEKDYNKKVTAEFCIGSTLHHGNVIETIDIVHEKGKWYEVMEYAPYDLFATVMTGKMGREEVTCSTLQILSGVLYLHSMGLAHRDLKLDNVVINEFGIMKLIDFGSAVVFRYPFENEIVLATGVVGSDPYLAPEVYDHSRYDPRAADIWSIAIIFCCMTLRRFPWKAPRTSDNSYRLFVSQPDADQDKYLDRKSGTSSSRGSVAPSEPPSRHSSKGDETNGDRKNSEPASRVTTASDSSSQPVIKGPVRLLRLLPRETRHIIGRMLEVDPRHRANMEEILRDPWVQNSLVCRQEENAVIIKAPNHTHTLQPSNAGSSK